MNAGPDAMQYEKTDCGAKSRSDWTTNELTAYNITVVYQDAATFFERPYLPQPTINPDVLTAPDPNDAADDDASELLSHMDLAMSPASAEEESVVDDYAILLLRALGYTRRGKHFRTRKDIPLVICGENRHAKTDVCIVDDNKFLLLVQEDKCHLEISDPEPQLIAEAIAAFSANNKIRQQTLARPPLPSKVMAGITTGMKGTAPTFYKINVTTELVTSVGGADIPTIFYAHVPSIPRPNRRWSEGMKPLDNRLIILSCYEAF